MDGYDEWAADRGLPKTELIDGDEVVVPDLRGFNSHEGVDRQVLRELLRSGLLDEQTLRDVTPAVWRDWLAGLLAEV